MNWRFTAIVFLVFLALGIFAYTQRTAPSMQVGEGAPTATPLALLELKAEDVQEVEVVGAGDQYKLARVAGGWQVDGQAASDEVAGVVERIGKPTVLRDLPSDRKPEDYGFATPSLTVTLKTAAGDTHVLEVGDDTPVDYNVYVRLKDQARIVIVSKSDIGRLKDWLTTPPLAPTATPTNTPEGTPPPTAEASEGTAGATPAALATAGGAGQTPAAVGSATAGTDDAGAGEAPTSLPTPTATSSGTAVPAATRTPTAGVTATRAATATKAP